MAISDLLENRFAVNPFGEMIIVDKTPETIEDVKLEILEISEKVNSVFEEYKKACSSYYQTRYNILKYFSRLKLDVLSPIGIDLVLQLIIKSNLLSDSHIAGVMISQLVNDSYNAGNNYFALTTNDSNINCLFSNVCGTEKNLVTGIVLGNVNYGFGSYSEHCAFDVKGNAGMSFGLKSKHCNYTIYGDAGILCGDESKDCTYNLYGTIDDCLSDDMRNSVFKVQDWEIYWRLCENLHSSNMIQMLDDTGKIIEEMKK